jgi:ADP-ribose pyrophosphatase
MPSFDAADCLRRYRDLVSGQSELFVNPPGLVYEILTAAGEMGEAREAAERSRKLHGLDVEDTRVGVLASDPYATVLREAVRFPDGSLGLYNRLIVPGGVLVLPILRGSIVLIHRFRHGTRRFAYEAPRGIAGEAESVETDARRELLEEIGAVAEEIVDLGEVATTSGIVGEVMRLFLARIDSVGAPDRHEAIAGIVCCTIAETEGMIVRGAISDGPTLAAYLRAKLAGLLG